MIAQENEEIDHLRPACVECTHRCNELHRDRDLEEEQFDPDRSWPHFGKKVTKLALHHSPTSALCIPATFMEEYPHSVQKGKPITLEGPSGNKWKVGAANRSVLHSGWRAFAHDHRLREGDRLHFRLTKPLYFVVDIFNSHGGVRRSARKATVTGKYAIAAAASQPGTVPHNQSRKRKDMAELAEIGKGIMHSLADRWKTPPARRGISFNDPTRLRFSETTKRWENHESDKDHVVTIDLDSDDEKAAARPSKIERLIEHMEEEEEHFITPKSQAPATQVGEDPSHQEIPNESEDDFEDEKKKQRVPSHDPLRQFTTIFDTSSIETLEKAMLKARKGKNSELSASDPLSLKAQINISCDEDMVMVKEEGDDEIHLIEHSEVDKITPQACVVVEKKLETSVAEPPDTPNEVEEKQEADEATKMTIIQHGVSDNHTNAHEAAAADYEFVTPRKADANHVQVTILTSITATSESMYKSELGTLAEDVKVTQVGNGQKENQGGLSFGLAPDNVEEFSVINGVQTDSVHPLKQGLKQADDLDDTAKQMEDEELHLTNSKNSDCIAETHNDLHVTKTQPEQEENPNMPVSLQNTKEKEKEKGVRSDIISNPEFTTPVKKEINIQARVAAPTYTNTCVLESKRSPVTQGDREKALKAAQACARKIPNPNFVAVMENSHVYTDFIMDIPAELGKQSKLPAKDVRVTLICDEVPTYCKAIWVGSKDQIDSKGWMNFSRSHCLEEGDVCVLECVSTNRLVVHIFRVVKLKRPIVLDWNRHYKVLMDPQNAKGN